MSRAEEEIPFLFGNLSKNVHFMRKYCECVLFIFC